MEIIHVTYRPYCNYYLSIRSAYRRSIIRITLRLCTHRVKRSVCLTDEEGSSPFRVANLRIERNNRAVTPQQSILLFFPLVGIFSPFYACVG